MECEVDAMGGVMALATDASGIQFRRLNASKGAAVRATRAQADRLLYKAFVRETLENQPNLDLFQQQVDDVLLEQDRIVGVTTTIGVQFHARAVLAGPVGGGAISGQVGVLFYDATGAFLEGQWSTVNTSNAASLSTVGAVAPANTAYARFSVRSTPSTAFTVPLGVGK